MTTNRKLYKILYGIGFTCFGGIAGKLIVAFPDYSRIFGVDVRIIFLLGTISLVCGKIVKLNFSYLEVNLGKRVVLGLTIVLVLLFVLWCWLIKRI